MDSVAEIKSIISALEDWLLWEATADKTRHNYHRQVEKLEQEAAALKWVAEAH